MGIKDILSHIPKTYNETIKKYVSDTVLLRSRYLFVRRDNREQYGFCTHCRKENLYGGLKHGDLAECSNCLSYCVVKSSGRGRKYLRDEGYFIWFDKSLKDPTAIVARGIFVQRDYSGEYTEVETTYSDTAAYVFEDGKARMANRPYYWVNEDWELRKSIFDERDSSFAHTQSFLSLESIENAVKDTRFQYSTWAHYRTGRLVQFFGLAANYPCVEYLTKFGMSSVVEAKLSGGRTYGAINWNGKTLDKVLKVTKHQLKEIRNADKFIAPYALWLYQQSHKDGSKLTFEEVYDLHSLCEGAISFDDLHRMQKFANLRSIRNYIKRQLGKGSPANYRRGRQVLIAWRDYVSDCEALQMGLSDDSLLFPSNLYEAHQATILKRKMVADEALNLKIKKRLPSLKEFELETGNLFIRPATDSLELINEGNALKHCVGSYAKNYADGKTSLFVIRKVDEPEIPFFTLEVKDGRVSQVYGLKNCHPSEKVQAFVDLFESVKLKKGSVAV